MRILHTADWHLGKMFYGGYLTEEQAYVLQNQFLPMIRDEHVDAVVLAGDVYDRSLPPAEAVGLFDEIATKITVELGTPFFVISGNHDSAARLSFGSRLLEKQGLYIAGALDKLSGPVLLEDTHGPVAFVPVPFADPAQVRHFLQDEGISGYSAALDSLCRYQGGSLPAEMRKVCIAHAFVSGGIASDSERPLSVGGADLVDAAIFSGFSYTALGHLHGPQQAGSEAIRYAGSLLKYSFGEARQKKGALLVDIDGAGQAKTTFLPFSPAHDVRVIEGAFDAIMAAKDEREDDFVLIRLTDQEPVLDGMARVRRKYPHALALEMKGRNGGGSTDRSFDLRRVTEQELFESFAESMRQEQPLTADERDCVTTLWQRLWKEREE